MPRRRDALVATVLVKCARHCCICRQFSPLHIQVHHIVERSKGGADELDNLMPVCITCHASIHSNPSMTCQYSALELRQHRDAVYAAVENGKLPAQKPPNHLTSDQIQTLALLAEGQPGLHARERLSKEALEILIAAACEEAPILIRPIGNSENNPPSKPRTYLSIGYQIFTNTKDYDAGLHQLLEQGLIEETRDSAKITNLGLELIESISHTLHTFIIKKSICLHCNLHFGIYTDFEHRHNSANLTCPECGQKGRFFVHIQKQFGFIFEHIPGRATLYDYPRLPKNEVD